MPQFFLTTSTTIKTSISYFFSLQLFQYFNQKLPIIFANIRV